MLSRSNRLNRRQLLLSSLLLAAAPASASRGAAAARLFEEASQSPESPAPPVPEGAGGADGTGRTNAATEAWLTERLEKLRKNYNLPGISCGLMLDGRIVAEVAVGVRKMGDPTPLLATDAQQIGSITKPFTTALTAKMVEKGVLAWHTTIGSVFPELVSTMQPSYQNITVPILLAHLSGMPYSPHTEPENGYVSLPIIEGRYAYVRAALQDKPEARPGEKFIYGGGPIIVAAMLERLTGQTWEDLMRETIFQPLRLTNARFGHAFELDPQGATVVWEHFKDANGVPRALLPAGEYCPNPSMSPEDFKGYTGPRFLRTHGPAGCIDCSPGDLLRFMAAYMPDASDATPFFTPASYRVLTHRINDLMSPGWAVDAASPIGQHQALELSHTGSNGRNNAEARFCPMSRNGYVWMTNAHGPVPGSGIGEFWNEISGLLKRTIYMGAAEDLPTVPFSVTDRTRGLTAEWWQYQEKLQDYIRPQFSFILRPDDLENRWSASVPWSNGIVTFDSGSYPNGGRLEYQGGDYLFGSWQHFAMTADAHTGEMLVYRNGVVEARKEDGKFLKPGDYVLCVGGDAFPFPGRIREFRLWDHVRSVPQIGSLMHQTVEGGDATATARTGLLAFYKGTGAIP